MTSPDPSPQERMHQRVDNDFTYHPPTVIQPEIYESIRTIARTYAHYLIDNCPQSRELSLAITNLEEVVFWANAAVARQAS